MHFSSPGVQERPTTVSDVIAFLADAIQDELSNGPVELLYTEHEEGEISILWDNALYSASEAEFEQIKKQLPVSADADDAQIKWTLETEESSSSAMSIDKLVDKILDEE